MHAPTFYKNISLQGLVEVCAGVAGETTLPFYLYDMPSLTGVSVSAAKFLQEAKTRIPNLVGIKYTNSDIVTVQECINLEGAPLDVLWGFDEALLTGVALGAHGTVGSTYNFATPLYKRILDAVSRDDWPTARREQHRAVKMVRIFERFGTLPSLKYMMALARLDCGPVRPPQTNLSNAQRSQLQTSLEEIDFFSFSVADARESRSRTDTAA